MKTMFTFARPGFRARHVPAEIVKDPPTNLHFSCSSCESKNQSSVHLIETARVVQGVRYCVECGDALVDDVVFKALCKALDGTLAWGKGRKAHELNASVLDPEGLIEFKIATICNCHGEGTLVIHHENMSAFLDAFAAFVEEHFSAIKAIVEQDSFEIEI